MQINEEKLAKLNKVLSVIALFLGIYITLIPFIPELQLYLNQRRDTTNGYVYQSALSEDKADEDQLQPIPEGKRLVIPKINVDEEIHEGSNISVIQGGGTWRRPLTSNPQDGGNTVIVGHRFGYNGDNTFYHLNKLLPGDEFAVFWDKQEFDYVIREVKEVPATAIEVENQTNSSQVTLYTCAGLSAERRFVVIADLVATTDYNKTNERNT